MEVEPGDIVVGLMVGAFGFVGLFLAAGALDDEMYVFGLSLVGFASAFVLGLICRHYDRERPTVALALAGTQPDHARVSSDV